MWMTRHLGTKQSSRKSRFERVALESLRRRRYPEARLQKEKFAQEIQIKRDVNKISRWRQS